MGDTGSLFLGGLMVGMAFMIDNPLIILIAGFMYILETISVMIQVTYFKLTHGKRFFKMAPIHHHFEQCGMSENKIVALFFTAQRSPVRPFTAGAAALNFRFLLRGRFIP